MGVRHAIITIGDQTVFDGEIDKGCGNQVFDYGKTINLIDVDSTAQESSAVHTPVMDKVSLFGSVDTELGERSRSQAGVRSETRLMNHSLDETVTRPSVEDQGSVPGKREEAAVRKSSKSPRKQTSREELKRETQDSPGTDRPRGLDSHLPSVHCRLNAPCTNY